MSFAVKLFEDLAAATWERLILGHQYGCSQSEETITDINLLDIMRAGLPSVRAYKTTKKEESERGFDWGWWIGSDERGWFSYCVQAKKLNIETNSYRTLRHKVGPKFQIDILKDYARCNRSTPLYCFYNHVDKTAALKHWNCTLPFDEEQLGCTLAPLKVVEAAHQLYASKKFMAIHKNTSVIPWRCLLISHYTNYLLEPQGTLAKKQRQENQHDELPQYLKDGNDIPTEVEISDNFESKLGGYPKRILVIDCSNPE